MLRRMRLGRGSAVQRSQILEASASHRRLRRQPAVPLLVEQLRRHYDRLIAATTTVAAATRIGRMS